MPQPVLDPQARYLAALEQEMRRHVSSETGGPQLLYNMLRYHLGWVDATFAPTIVDHGKRVRPMLLLLAAEAQGGNWQQALPAAASVELLHNFTLIHDDIEDRDAVRRGRPTLWSLWGIPQAINAGDALFALSYQALLSLRDRGVDVERITHAVARYTSAVVRITEGQCYDISFESVAEIPEGTYLAMVSGKTAALTGLATELGAIVAGASSEASLALREFGEALGMAFQMQDDLLGLWGDPATTGKPVGSDLLKRKKTLPIVHGMRADKHLREFLRCPEHLLESTVTEVLAMIEEAGSRTYVEAQARSFHTRALAALAASGGRGAPHAALRTLADSLLGRQK